MSPTIIFQIQLILGYVAWIFCFRAYFWPRLKAMDAGEAQRAIATLHAFRFFGLVFLVPGLVGPKVQAEFAVFAAYGDFATGVLAMLALVTIRTRFFWPLVVVYNLVGAADLLGNYYHGSALNIGAWAGDLGFTYAIPIIYVPILMISHVTAFYLLIRRAPHTSSARQAVTS
jgi:hypothetical protein